MRVCILHFFLILSDSFYFALLFSDAVFPFWISTMITLGLLLLHFGSRTIFLHVNCLLVGPVPRVPAPFRLLQDLFHGVFSTLPTFHFAYSHFAYLGA